ncbi:MAG: glycosyltransferase family 2 protein [Bacteroidota bacterium]
MPSISIITATYNSEATLKETLTSVQSQILAAREVLIQDGGSTDKTLNIAKQFPSVVVRTEPDSGLYDAMNRGISRATGDIIGILNSDDYYADASVLSDVAELFASKPHIDAVYGDLDYVQQDQPRKVVRHWQAGEGSRFRWRRGWMPPHPTFFVRRSVYDKYGTFNLSFRYAADYELMLRLCYKHKIKLGYIPRVLVKMRTGGVSNSSLRNRLIANQEDQRAWRINGMPTPRGLAVTKPLLKLGQWI